MSQIEDIAASVSALAAPGMKPKDLFAATREMHPKASKKEVVRAAFYAVILQAEADPEKARRLQEAALSARLESDELAVVTDAPPRERKKKTKSNGSNQS